MLKTYKLEGFNIFEYKELNSTNTKAESLDFSYVKDRDVILTWKQTAGRGQTTNKWESDDNKNISLTLILKPDNLEAVNQFVVSMVISLGVVRFLQRYVENVKIKWPNDIYVGDKKICGILIEHAIAGSTIAYSLCGIGININQKEFFSNALNPISLFQILNRELDLQQVLGELLTDINVYYYDIAKYSTIKEEFLEKLYRKDGVWQWCDTNGIFEAQIVGIDDFGQLILEDILKKQRIYAFKELKYL